MWTVTAWALALWLPAGLVQEEHCQVLESSGEAWEVQEFIPPAPFLKAIVGLLGLSTKRPDSHLTQFLYLQVPGTSPSRYPLGF